MQVPRPFSLLGPEFIFQLPMASFPQPDRREMANTVMNDPASYKLCLVCGAIVDRSADTCPDCYAYRFDESSEHVANKALDLAARPQTAVSHLDSVE